jgi:hypothetical protein
MSTAEPTTYSFPQACQIANSSLGGRADVHSIGRAVRDIIGEQEYVTLTWPNFISRIRQGLVEKDGLGLPKCVSIGEGVYVQRDLLEEDEHAAVVTSYCDRANQNVAIARKLNDEHFARFGAYVDISAHLDYGP